MFTIPLFTACHSPPVSVARPAAGEVEGEVEEAGHHEGRHHHPRVGDHQAHVLKHELPTLIKGAADVIKGAALSILIHHRIFIINTLNKIVMSVCFIGNPTNYLFTCDKLKWMLNSTIETTEANACKASYK